MAGHRAIQVGTIAAIFMICYDARYLLVSIDDENGGETGNIRLILWTS